jgi:hypothetical protein
MAHSASFVYVVLNWSMYSREKFYVQSLPRHVMGWACYE